MKKFFSDGKIVDFLFDHCEKIVFGLAVLLVIWIALPDSDRKPIDESQRGPQALSQKSQQATNHLEQDSWPRIRDIRISKEDILKRSRNDINRVAVASYPAPMPWNKPFFPFKQKRRDPKLYPVEDLQIAVSYGAVSVSGTDADDRSLISGHTLGEVRPFPLTVQKRLSKFGELSGSDSATESRYIVAVLGKIPIQKQKEEYESLFAEAADYDESRDMPNYGAGEDGEYGQFIYMVERAEVATDGSIGPFSSSWGRTHGSHNSRTAKYVQRQWSGGETLGTFVDSRYIDERFSMNVPPLLLRDLMPLARHSDFPEAGSLATAAETIPNNDTEKPPTGLGAPGANVPPSIGGNPANPTRSPSAHEGGESGKASGLEDIDYLQFRYFDMDAEPGKNYVYRVKLYLEDPNFPSPSKSRPQPRVLAKEVIDRLNRRPKKDVWWRETPPSEVSPVAHVPTTDQMLVGPVNPGTVIQPPRTNFTIRLTERTADIMALVWDREKALDVPGVQEAARGAVLNFQADVEAIDASRDGLVTLPAYSFQTNSIVLDLRGGDWFSRKKKVAYPGEVLLLDADGNLAVHSELDDSHTYRDFIFPDADSSSDLTPSPSVRPPRGDTDGPIDLFGR